jgi:sigma-B regulation protein RsbU (phosphoserine phosphatase)
VRSDGSAHKIESSGTLVGVWEQVEFENVLVELEPNDMLVFYTDGLIEAYAPTRILEPNDVAHALASSPSRKLTDIIQKLEHDFLHESGDNPRDDVVILALRSAATAKNTQPSSADRNSAKTAGRFEKH